MMTGTQRQRGAQTGETPTVSQIQTSAKLYTPNLLTPRPWWGVTPPPPLRLRGRTETYCTTCRSSNGVYSFKGSSRGRPPKVPHRYAVTFRRGSVMANSKLKISRLFTPWPLRIFCRYDLPLTPGQTLSITVTKVAKWALERSRHTCILLSPGKACLLSRRALIHAPFLGTLAGMPMLVPSATRRTMTQSLGIVETLFYP